MIGLAVMRLVSLVLTCNRDAAQQFIQAEAASRRGLIQVLGSMGSSSMVEKSTEASTLSFRTAHRNDLPELVRMLADDPLGADREAISSPLTSAYADAFAAIEEDPNNELMVAVFGNCPVGMLQITFIPYLTYQGRWRALVEGVRVSSNARSHGVGGAMLQWAIELARARDCVMVQLTTDRTRDDALRFYERLGFVSSHHGMKLHL